MVTDRTSSNNASIVKDLIVLALLGTALWLTSSGMWDLRGPDEGRYVQIAKELLQRDNWLYLTVNGNPYDQKPPLAFWFFAFMLRLTKGDVIAWAVRLPGVIAAIITVLMTYLMGRHSYGRRPGLFAGLILMTSPLFIESAPAAELNMLYTAGIATALWAWITRPDNSTLGMGRVIVFWMSLTAAFFIKGPLALLIVLCVPLWEAWRRGNWKLLKILHGGWGLLIMGAAIGTWLLVQGSIYGNEFVKQQVSSETLHRVLAGDHAGPFWYYFPRLVTVMFPWSLLLIPVAVYLRSVSSRKLVLAAGSPYFPWLMVPFVLLCLVHGKRQSYLLPLLPAAAIVLGKALDILIARKPLPQFVRHLGLFVVGGVTVGVALILAATAWTDFVHSDLIWLTENALWILGLCGVLLAVIAFAVSRANSYQQFVYLTAGLILVVAWGNFMLINPALDPSKSTRYFSDAIEMALDNNAAIAKGKPAVVGAVGEASRPEYHVYGNYTVRKLKQTDLPTLLDSATAPELLLMKSNSSHSAFDDTALRNAGYTFKRELVASKDALSLYSRQYRPTNFQYGSDIEFLLVGDTGTGDPQIYNVVREMARRADARPTDAIFLLGDNLYGKDSELSDAVRHEFTLPFTPLLQRKIPIFAALGNHDHNSKRMRGEMEFPPFNMGGRRYYSLEYGLGKNSVSVFVCDAETLRDGGDESQLQWLESKVKSSDSAWKLLILHRPVQASKVRHGASRNLNRVLQPVLGDVDVVIAGHNHIYERRKLANGALHLTVGSGGKLTTDPLPEDAERAVGYNQAGVFLEMTIADGKMQLTAWNEFGKKVDTVTLEHSRANALEITGF